jgi:hypothetical protein
MTDIGSRAARRRPGFYAWLALGPVAAAGAIAMFIAAQPAVAATPPAGLGTVSSLPGLGSAGSLAGLGSAGNLPGLGSAGNLAGLGSVGSLAGLNGTGDTGTGSGGTSWDHCQCMSPPARPTTPPPPAETTPPPTATRPSPPPPGHTPRPAPIPTPVGNTFPVTG